MRTVTHPAPREHLHVRVTVEFDDDVADGIEDFRRSEGSGMSEAVNELVRRGLLHRSPGRRFEQRTRPMGLRIDVTCVAAALDDLKGPKIRLREGDPGLA
jgi:hypothetical protein